MAAFEAHRGSPLRLAFEPSITNLTPEGLGQCVRFGISCVAICGLHRFS